MRPHQEDPNASARGRQSEEPGRSKTEGRYRMVNWPSTAPTETGSCWWWQWPGDMTALDGDAHPTGDGTELTSVQQLHEVRTAGESGDFLGRDHKDPVAAG